MGLFSTDRQAQPKPASSGQRYVLHPEADRHTSSAERGRKLSQAMTEPLYEVRDIQSGRHYVQVPASSHYGPHFEKGPDQEEMWNKRQGIEVWHSDKRLDKVVFDDENCGRAHEFQEPIRQHQYSDPYEIRPTPWTDQMTAEYKEYHHLAEDNVRYKQTIRGAKNTVFGRNQPPTLAHGRAIETGLLAATAARTVASQAAQARSGFGHKYPKHTQRQA